MPTAFTRTVEQAQEAGFTPTRRTVSIVAVKQLTAGIVRLTFRDEYIAHHVRPAQFVNLYSSNPMHLMPRPFGVSEVDGDEVSLIFAVVGFGTDEFSKLTAGDTIDVLGPLGTPFNLDEAADYVLVGGGLGIPPLLEAAQSLRDEADSRAIAVFGYRDEHFRRHLCCQVRGRSAQHRRVGGQCAHVARTSVAGIGGERAQDDHSVLRSDANDESRGHLGLQTWRGRPTEHGAAHGMRVWHLCGLHNRHTCRPREGV